MRRHKRKLKIVNGIEMFYCPDCGDYVVRELMMENMCRRYGIGTYCKKHDYLRKQERRRNRDKWEERNYKINHRVSNERKWYFRGKKQNISRGPIITVRTYGISKLWGRKPYERKCLADD